MLKYKLNKKSINSRVIIIKFRVKLSIIYK